MFSLQLWISSVVLQMELRLETGTLSLWKKRFLQLLGIAILIGVCTYVLWSPTQERNGTVGENLGLGCFLVLLTCSLGCVMLRLLVYLIYSDVFQPKIYLDADDQAMVRQRRHWYAALSFILAHVSAGVWYLSYYYDLSSTERANWTDILA